MSLSEQAAQIAQEQGREARKQHQANWNALVARVEKKVSHITGLTAVFVSQVDVAQIEEKGGGAYSFAPRAKVVAHKKMMHVRVDDVDFLVDTQVHRASRTETEVYLGRNDPEHGWYQPVEYHSFYTIGDSKNPAPAEERTEKFVRDLAIATTRATLDHPVVQLQREHETCPTCGRGY